MREYLWKLVVPRAVALVACGLLVASFSIGGVAIVTATTVGAADCASSGGVPCSPIGSGEQAGATELSRGPSIQGRIEPDDAPAASEADAAAADALAGSIGSPPEARAKNSTFTFYNRNSSGKQINFRFFSQNRNWVWPGGNQYWYIPPDRKQYYVVLSCQRGEKVCVGGWWPSNPRVYWGVGQQGNKGCSSCCYICKGGQAAVNFVR